MLLFARFPLTFMAICHVFAFDLMAQAALSPVQKSGGKHISTIPRDYYRLPATEPAPSKRDSIPGQAALDSITYVLRLPKSPCPPCPCQQIAPADRKVEVKASPAAPASTDGRWTILDDQINKKEVRSNDEFGFVARNTDNGDVEFAWHDAGTEAPEQFLILRRADFGVWEYLGGMKALPPDLAGKSYRFLDPYPPNGKVQYLLKKITVAGEERVSKVIMVEL